MVSWVLEMLGIVIEAFAALTEAAECDYLRGSLPLKQYIRDRQKRAELARKCLKYIGRSASLISAVEAAPENNSEIRATIEQLRRTACRVRCLVAIASAYFFVVWLFPKRLSFLKRQVDAYREFLLLACSHQTLLAAENLPGNF
jgi:hypothetical protein